MTMRFAGVFRLASAIGCAASLFPSSSWGEAKTSCSVPLETDEWQTVSPNEAGLDAKLLFNITAHEDNSE
jgi:hypothetical protein